MGDELPRRAPRVSRGAILQPPGPSFVFEPTHQAQRMQDFHRAAVEYDPSRTLLRLAGSDLVSRPDVVVGIDCVLCS